MATVELDAVQIQSCFSPSSVQPFWLFDGNNVAEEVDNLARRCRTVSPGHIKQELYYEKRPHSTAGVPLHANNKNKRNREKKHSRPIYKTTNIQEDKFIKVLGKFQPPKFKEAVIGPGYVISQGKDEVTARIKSNQLFDPDSFVQHVKRKQNQRPDDRDQTIEILKRQIDDLSAFLEEARVQHKMEIKKIIDHHKEELEKQRTEHTEHLRAIEADHQDEITKLEESQEIAIDNIRTEANQERDQLARELKFTKAAFESYKETVKEELNTKWKEKELQLKLEFDRKTELLLQEQRHEMTVQKNKELDNQSKEQRRQISAIVESNRKEMDILLRKFTASAADAERVHEFMTELQRVRSENSLLSNQLDETKKMYRASKNELNDVKVHLQTYKEHFEEKVAEVDDKYSQKINGLLMDNSTLRKQYLKKCDELYKVKSDIDVKKEGNTATAKDIMQQLIRSRARADVSLTALRDDAEEKVVRIYEAEDIGKKKGSSSRPLSAPSTPKETASAVTSSSGGYGNSAARKKMASNRPSSSFIRTSEKPATLSVQFLERSLSANKGNATRRQAKSATPVITLSPPKSKSTKSLNSRNSSSASILKR